MSLLNKKRGTGLEKPDTLFSREQNNKAYLDILTLQCSRLGNTYQKQPSLKASSSLTLHFFLLARLGPYTLLHTRSLLQNLPKFQHRNLLLLRTSCISRNWKSFFIFWRFYVWFNWRNRLNHDISLDAPDLALGAHGMAAAKAEGTAVARSIGAITAVVWAGPWSHLGGRRGRWGIFWYVR